MCANMNTTILISTHADTYRYINIYIHIHTYIIAAWQGVSDVQCVFHTHTKTSSNFRFCLFLFLRRNEGLRKVSFFLFFFYKKRKKEKNEKIIKKKKNF